MTVQFGCGYSVNEIQVQNKDKDKDGEEDEDVMKLCGGVEGESDIEKQWNMWISSCVPLSFLGQGCRSCCSLSAVAVCSAPLNVQVTRTFCASVPAPAVGSFQVQL